MSESDGALGDDSSSEVLERGSLHLVVTEVVSVGGGAEQRKKKKEKRKKSSVGLFVRD